MENVVNKKNGNYYVKNGKSKKKKLNKLWRVINVKFVI